MKTKFNDFKITESVTPDEKDLVNGSGLFHWNSSVKDEEKLEIVKWYKSLDDKFKKYINILRDESYDDGYDSGANDESL